MSNFVIKSVLFVYLWAKILKTIALFEISILNFVYLQKFTKKKKKKGLNFGPKVPYFGIFVLEF